ncbi:MAG: hypothetical protein H7061_09615 [Bdellovibrionaceae bacterium]|nr:hypothetical protein [Bdellovibrio sp.]
MKFLIIFLVTLGFTPFLLAKNIGNEGDTTYVAGMSVFYYNQATESGSGPGGHATHTIYDLKAGRASNKGLYLGVIYSSRNDDLAGAAAAGSHLGASIGYFGRSGLHAVAHYIAAASLGSAGGFTKGTGLQADFGYLASATSNFFIGVDISYRSISYQEQGGVALASPFKQTELFPMLSFAFTLM